LGHILVVILVREVAGPVNPAINLALLSPPGLGFQCLLLKLRETLGCVTADVEVDLEKLIA
jgi:hypothetical protein